MATIYDIESIQLVDKAAEELKKVKEIEMPKWARFVKTSPSRERQPLKSDWWYARSASVLRKIYIKGPIGVNKLRKNYSGKGRRGHNKARVYSGSGKIIRVILQQLEKAEFITQDQKKDHKGRIITSKGKKFLNAVSKSLKK